MQVRLLRMPAPSPAIKRTDIPLSGYLYQNLVGLSLLCDWLDDPGIYNRVRFEADHDEVPQGLDDIVAQRRDATLVLLQVKFTVNAALMEQLHKVSRAPPLNLCRSRGPQEQWPQIAESDSFGFFGFRYASSRGDQLVSKAVP